MRYLATILLSVLLTFGLSAQDYPFTVEDDDTDYSIKKHREVGINMTALLSQILPFQSSTELVGPFHLHYKGGNNNRFFSMKIGAKISSFRDDNNFLNFAVGYNRRREVGERFNMNIGYHIMVIGGSFNDPVNNVDTRFGGLGGVGFSWDIGFQYKISSRMSVGTGTILFVGPTSDTFAVTFIPPVGIFLVGRLK